VQVISGGSFSGLEESLIGRLVCPLLNKGGLSLREIRPHREIGLRQKNRRTIIHPVGLGEKRNHPSAKVAKHNCAYAKICKLKPK
jgi:hypothetical protein